jgi:invasion protein IalB
MKTLKTTPLALMLALALAAPALAQETTEAPATDAPATDAPATDAGVAADAGTTEGLSMGAEVGAAPGVGDTYTAATFEAWEQRCIKTESGADPCQLYQLLKDEKGNAVAEFSVFSLPEGSEGPAVAGATFIAPLETLLTAGLTLQVDTNKPRAYPFTFCGQIGCVARIGFTAEEIASFKKGANAMMTILPFVAPDQKVSLTVSLKGFTAGFDAVAAANKAADAAAPAEAPAEAPASGD